nr:BofC C-terminal domain-containing protein [Cohnella sp. CFH 77786]
MLGRHSAGKAAELLKSRRDWEASFETSGRLVLQENVEDLSPACRQTAYIGMDADGNLSLFDGPPRKDNVVRTFFQLDIRSLESSLSKEKLHELADGIRVSDRDEYRSVLSSFSDFARKSEGVMKQQR